MKSLGIIAEFNPFHGGHKYLIDRAMSETGSDICVAVMSGDFVQRGGPASFDKWKRAEMAIENGVNLVVELPAIYAVSSADYFAYGGVKTLESLGGIDTLAFGSESGDVEGLLNITKFIEAKNNEITALIKEYCSGGHAYPKAREMAILELSGGENIDIDAIKAPNNILAIEYLKHLEKMKPFTVKRNDEGHHESASAIRKKLYEEFPEKFKSIDDAYFNIVRYKLLTTEREELLKILSADEGLISKLHSQVRYAKDLDDLIMRSKSKAYTYSRISRLLAQCVLGIKKDLYNKEPSYVRVLAFDKKGAKFIKDVKKKELNSVPIITNVNKERNLLNEEDKTLDCDVLASDIYNLISGADLYSGTDLVKKPIIV